MSRFLMLLAVTAVAGAMYVAAAPGGLRSIGPSARQFKALSTKVTRLQKEVAQVKKLSLDESAVLVGCLLHQTAAVDRLGTAGTSGYLFGTASAPQPTTALDLAPTTETSSQFYFLGVSPNCASAINSAGGATTASTSGTVQHLLSLQGGSR